MGKFSLISLLGVCTALANKPDYIMICYGVNKETIKLWIQVLNCAGFLNSIHIVERFSELRTCKKTSKDIKIFNQDTEDLSIHFLPLKEET